MVDADNNRRRLRATSDLAADLYQEARLDDGSRRQLPVGAIEWIDTQIREGDDGVNWGDSPLDRPRSYVEQMDFAMRRRAREQGVGGPHVGLDSSRQRS